MLAFMRYFFMFKSINSQTSSSKLAETTRKHLHLINSLDEHGCAEVEAFFERKSLSNSLMSSFRLEWLDVDMLVVRWCIWQEINKNFNLIKCVQKINIKF